MHSGLSQGWRWRTGSCYCAKGWNWLTLTTVYCPSLLMEFDCSRLQSSKILTLDGFCWNCCLCEERKSWCFLLYLHLHKLFFKMASLIHIFYLKNYFPLLPDSTFVPPPSWHPHLLSFSPFCLPCFTYYFSIFFSFFLPVVLKWNVRIMRAGFFVSLLSFVSHTLMIVPKNPLFAHWTLVRAVNKHDNNPPSCSFSPFWKILPNVLFTTFFWWVLPQCVKNKKGTRFKEKYSSVVKLVG